MQSAAVSAVQSIGRFAVGERIAAGGMASVYNAQAPPGDQLNGFPLAIKVLHDHLADDPQFVRMFMEEGRITSRFLHPGIVRVYEVGSDGGSHYIAMERVDGYNLAQVLAAHRRANKTFAKAASFDILRQVLSALAYVHAFKGQRGGSLGIVHRDISPHNLLIGRAGRVKLADFGIARGSHRADRTATGTVKGKLHYMAPEQARGQRVDLRADLYALGAVAFELFTRQPLHDVDRTSVVHERAAAGAISFDRPEFMNLSPDLQTWLIQALNTDPNRRFQTAVAMLDGLDRLKGVRRSSFKAASIVNAVKLVEEGPRKPATQSLFIEDLSGNRGSAPAGPQRVQTPGRPMSGVFVGVAGVSRNDVRRVDRLDASSNRPDGWETPPPVPSSRSRKRTRSGDVAVMLPVEKVNELSEPGRRRRRRADRPSASASAQLAGNTDGPVQGSTEDGNDAGPTGDRPAVARSERSKAKQKAESTAPSGRPMQSREFVGQQRGVAAAGFVMWCGLALLLLGMLLEAWNAQVVFPAVNQDTFAGWFGGAAGGAATAQDDAQLDSTDAAARPIEPPVLRNDRFLPRGTASTAEQTTTKQVASPESPR